MRTVTFSEPLLMALVRHYDDLVNHIGRQFRDRDSDRSFAREVVHDVCVDLIERPPGQPVHTPLAWLRTAATHRAIDQCRADATRSALVEPLAEPPDSIVDLNDGASAMAFKQHLQALVDIVESLPPRARQVFILHRVHGMAQQEIATAVGISRNMVTQHYRRAMASIEAGWAPLQPHAAS